MIPQIQALTAASSHRRGKCRSVGTTFNDHSENEGKT